MSRIRQPAVANRFYPGDAAELTRMVDAYLAAAGPRSAPPKALIVPHAGYIYSGPIAASGYATLTAARDRIHRVVLLGPSHRVPFRGLATTAADAFATPLGEIPLDTQAIALALTLPDVTLLDEAHAVEHSLEVQLPFLQRVLGDFSLVPFVVGKASIQEVGALLDLLWDGPETLILISSDLSHYLSYAQAQAMDTATSHAIEALQPASIGYEQACGRNAVNGLLDAARRHGLRARTLDLRNSGDTAGNKDQVVGYGAYVFH